MTKKYTNIKINMKSYEVRRIEVSFRHRTDIEKNENEKHDKENNNYIYNGDNSNNNDDNNNNNNNNNNNRDKIDLMTMNPLLANVFEEDEDDGENIDLA